MAAAMMTPLQMREPANTYNMMTLQQAQALLPALDLGVFLKTLGITPPARVQVLDVNAMKALQRLLTELPPDDVKLLLRWFVVAGRAAELGGGYRGMEEEFSRLRKGLKEPPQRERVITQQIAAQLYHPLSQLYVQANFPDSTRREITEMVAHMKDEFASRLRSNAWLDDATRKAALEKLAKIDIQVGYPGTWVDFSPLDIRADDHFGNVQRAARFASSARSARSASRCSATASPWPPRPRRSPSTRPITSPTTPSTSRRRSCSRRSSSRAATSRRTTAPSAR
jgi:putative endopeptidase